MTTHTFLRVTFLLLLVPLSQESHVHRVLLRRVATTAAALGATLSVYTSYTGCNFNAFAAVASVPMTVGASDLYPVEVEDPASVLQSVNSALKANKAVKQEVSLAVLKDAWDRVLTLKAYLDEAERDILDRNWKNLQIYLITFAEQEDAFAALIDGLFPTTDPIDKASRDALSYQAQQTFLWLDELRDSAQDKNTVGAQRAYAELLLCYDRFLKAGDLYPTYDPITSTEIFFGNIAKSQLRYNTKDAPTVWDRVLLIEGPDMGKTGTILDTSDYWMIVKFDRNGYNYQEVKNVQRSAVAKILDGDGTAVESSTRKSSFPRIRNQRDYLLRNKGMKPNNALRKGLLLENE